MYRYDLSIYIKNEVTLVLGWFFPKVPALLTRCELLAKVPNSFQPQFPLPRGVMMAPVSWYG